MPKKDKKSKNKKYKQIKVKKDFTKIGLQKNWQIKKVDKKCKRFYIFCFGILWCKVLCEFVKIMENFCAKSFCKKNVEKSVAGNVGEKFNKILSSKILKQVLNIVAYQWSE